MIIDRSLALACELGERNGIRRCLQAGQQNFPELGIDIRELAGGLLGYSGIGGSLSQATAIAITTDVSRSDVDEITNFFRGHRCTPRVETGPLTNPALVPLLARAGYVPVKYENMLVADLNRLDGERNERITVMRDEREWAQASAGGFCDGADPDEEALTVSLLIATGGATALEVRDGGAIVATACYALEENGIALFAASTLPSHRRQGWQRAMIRERIARAKEAEMRFARVTAEPLSDSERNFRALGFVPLYTRTTWEWRS